MGGQIALARKASTATGDLAEDLLFRRLRMQIVSSFDMLCHLLGSGEDLKAVRALRRMNYFEVCLKKRIGAELEALSD